MLPFDSIERSDQIVANIYGLLADTANPLLRYSVLADILGHPDHRVVGFSYADPRQKIVQDLSKHKHLEYNDCIEQIHEISRIIFHDTTYSVASYWSPLDKFRRSIFKTKERSDEERHKSLASAALFYALTHLGRRLTTVQTSLVHYISEIAAIKRGPTMDFREAVQDVGECLDTIHVPKDVQEIFDKIGIRDLIDRLADKRALVHLESDFLSLTTDPGFSPRPLYLELARAFYEKIDGQMLRLTGGMRAYFQSVAWQLSKLLHGPSAADQVDARAALTFILFNQIWRCAVDEKQTALMYVFPTAVAQTCCVLTLGSREPLTPERRLAISHFAQASFVQPLVLDYRTTESRAYQSRNNNIFRRMLGHNLPKFLITPGLTEISKLERWRTELVRTPDGRAAIHAMDRIRMLLLHYEKFLIAIMGSDRLEEDFQRKAEVFTFDTDIWPIAQTAFEYAREQLISKELRRAVSLAYKKPRPDTPVVGHKSFVAEILLNLISNALRSLRPTQVREEPLRARVGVEVSLGKEYSKGLHNLIVTVSDGGIGFDRHRLAQFDSELAAWHDCGRAEFWPRVTDAVERALENRTNEGNLGIGLIFCAAYLRSLEWHEQIGRAGSVAVTSSAAGSTVTVSIPGAQPNLGRPGQ